MHICKFCCGERKNAHSLRNHERLCKENPNRQTHRNQYTKAMELGLPKPLVSEETRIKISESIRGKVWSEERKAMHSATMKRAVLANPDSYTSSNVCGRVKLKEYKGEKFHGNWEIEVAKQLDLEDIKWERKTKPFNYFWNGKWHLYFPDFYLPEFDLYLEVKGYEVERDRCKWSVVGNIVILKKKEIDGIKRGVCSIKAVLANHNR